MGTNARDILMADNCLFNLVDIEEMSRVVRERNRTYLITLIAMKEVLTMRLIVMMKILLMMTMRRLLLPAMVPLVDASRGMRKEAQEQNTQRALVSKL